MDNRIISKKREDTFVSQSLVEENLTSISSSRELKEIGIIIILKMMGAFQWIFRCLSVQCCSRV